MEMLTLRNTLKDLAIVESEAHRLERLAENVKMAMDDHCRAAAQMKKIRKDSLLLETKKPQS